MSADRDVNRIVQSWLEEGVTALPDRVLDNVLDQLHANPQHRPLWPARRLRHMNASMRLIAAGAAAVLALGVIAITFWPKAGGIAAPGSSSSPPPSPTQSAAATPTASGVALPDGPLTPGTYVMVPCSAPPCTTSDDSIRLTIDVPDGWSGVAPAAVWIAANAAPGGAAVGVGGGANLYRDPCLTKERIAKGVSPEIDVGSTVDGFATAIATHPVLDATDPVDVSLGGYSGKYIDLRLPADLSSCEEFRPWEPGIYAQGPNHQWHLWILDVDGARVVVQSMDYPGTSAQHRTELQAMVNSIKIHP
jgi:hypothetical protein